MVLVFDSRRAFLVVGDHSASGIRPPEEYHEVKQGAGIVCTINGSKGNLVCSEKFHRSLATRLWVEATPDHSSENAFVHSFEGLKPGAVTLDLVHSTTLEESPGPLNGRAQGGGWKSVFL